MIPPCHTAFLSLASALCLCASFDFFFSFKHPASLYLARLLRFIYSYLFEGSSD